MNKDAKSYTEAEFALILAKAAQLARSADTSSGDLRDGVSLDEMKAIAAEAGLDPALVERAALLVPAASEGSLLQRVIGGP